jgi:hydrogenase/urease accessory protein HupE
VLARVNHGEGRTQTARLTPGDPTFRVTSAPGRLAVAAAYLGLGVEHILLGIDHLLFVLALLFLVKNGRHLVGAITAFTAAHSLTLAAATLGWIDVPAAPVEAAIALSIVFVAAEIVRGGGLAGRQPWMVSFCFGLLHGLGFAGGLREVGLPDDAIPVALAFFNVGVEAGQVLFVAAVLAAFALGSRAMRPLASGQRRAFWEIAGLLARPAAYAIGIPGAFWLLERTLSFWEV